MTRTYQQPLWGYEMDLPPGWQHQRFSGKDAFATDPEAFRPGYQGESLAQLLIQGEWNSLHKPADQLWNRHLGRTSLLLGAKNIGTARWEMAGAAGYEAEIVLPKKSRQRMWAGMLEKGELVLEFLVLHWKDNRDEMEPLISRIISSLRLIPTAEGPETHPGRPSSAPGFAAVSLTRVIDDIQDFQPCGPHTRVFFHLGPCRPSISGSCPIPPGRWKNISPSPTRLTALCPDPADPGKQATHPGTAARIGRPTPGQPRHQKS